MALDWLGPALSFIGGVTKKKPKEPNPQDYFDPLAKSASQVGMSINSAMLNEYLKKHGKYIEFTPEGAMGIRDLHASYVDPVTGIRITQEMYQKQKEAGDLLERSPFYKSLYGAREDLVAGDVLSRMEPEYVLPDDASDISRFAFEASFDAFPKTEAYPFEEIALSPEEKELQDHFRGQLKQEPLTYAPDQQVRDALSDMLMGQGIPQELKDRLYGEASERGRQAFQMGEDALAEIMAKRGMGRSSAAAQAVGELAAERGRSMNEMQSNLALADIENRMRSREIGLRSTSDIERTKQAAETLNLQRQQLASAHLSDLAKTMRGEKIRTDSNRYQEWMRMNAEEIRRALYPIEAMRDFARTGTAYMGAGANMASNSYAQQMADYNASMANMYKAGSAAGNLMSNPSHNINISQPHHATYDANRHNPYDYSKYI